MQTQRASLGEVIAYGALRILHGKCATIQPATAEISRIEEVAYEALRYLPLELILKEFDKLQISEKK